MTYSDIILRQIGICFRKFADALGEHVITLGKNISANMINGLNNSDGFRRGMGKVKNKLSPLGQRPEKRTVNRTIGVSGKSCLKLLAG